jgi:sugar phosphate isomerase/epimerase
MTTHPSRRQFFGAAAAAAAWTTGLRASRLGETGGTGTESVTAGGQAAPLKLGVASYSMREFPLDDIRVAIHNHGPENKNWPRPQDAYAAVRSRDKRLGLCIDIGHTLRTGTDPIAACRECRDRLYDMHVKDLAVKTDAASQVEVGRGVIDFPALFRTLIEIGYQGQVGLEYEIKAKDPLPGMIESMAYMRGVLAAVAS